MFKLLLNLWEFCESVMPQCASRWLYNLFSWFGSLVQRGSSVVPSYHNPKIPLQPSAVDSASAPKEPEQIREEIGATGAKWCQPCKSEFFLEKWVFIFSYTCLWGLSTMLCVDWKTAERQRSNLH